LGAGVIGDGGRGNPMLWEGKKTKNREYKDRSLSSTNKTDPSKKKKGDTKELTGWE